MATKKICDRCGNDIKVDDNKLIDFLDGSLEISDVDLCEECFQVLAELIKKFTNDEESVRE